MNIIIYICKDLIVIHINMQTFRELVYMVMDELKLYSDDSNFTEDHIIMLLVYMFGVIGGYSNCRYSMWGRCIPKE